MSNPLENIAEQIRRAIEETIRNITNRLDNIPQNILNQIRNELSSLTNTANNIANAVRDAVTASVNTAVNTAREVGTNIRQGIETVVNTAAQTTQNVINTARDGIESAVTLTRNAVADTINTTKNAIASTIDAAKSMANNAVDVAKNGISNAINTAATFVNNATATVGRGIENAINSAANFVNNAVQNVKTGIEALSVAVYTNVNRTLEFVRNAVTESVVRVVTAFSNAVGQVYGEIRTIYNTLIATYNAFERAITQSITTLVQNAVQTVTTVFEQTKNVIVSGVQDAVQKVELGFQITRDFITQKISEAIAFLDNEWKNIVESLKAYYRGFIEFAKLTYQSIENYAGFIGNGALGATELILSGDYDDIASVVRTLSKLFSDSNIPYAFFASLALANVLSSAIPIVAEPYLANVRNRAYARALSGTLAVETLANAVAMRAMTVETARAMAAKIGIASDLLDSVVVASEEKLSIGQIVNAVWDNRIDATSAEALARQSGIASDTFRYALEFARPIATDSQIVNAAYQNVIDAAQARNVLRSRGYDETDVNILFAQNLRNLGLEAIIELYNRSFINDEQFTVLLREGGYRERDIAFIKQLTHRLPSLSDLIRFGLKDVFNPEYVNTYQLLEELPQEFIEYGKMYGLKEHEIKWYWASSWNLPSNTQGYEMYHRRIITKEQLEMLLKFNDVPAFWREKMIEMAYNPLTRVDVRRMYQTGVIGEQEVYEAYLDLGYNPANARRLTNFTVRLSAQDEEDEQSRTRNATKSEILNAYRAGIITREEAKNRLQTLRYSTEDAELFLRMADAGTISEESKRATPDILRRTIKYVENAYKDNFLTDEAAISLLKNAGLTEQQARSYLAIFALEDDYEDDMQIVAQLTKAYEKYAIDERSVRNILRELGMSDEGIERQITEMSFLRLLNARIPSIAEARKWYKQGKINRELFETILLGNDVSDAYIDLYIDESENEDEKP